jgi:parvulin-like peptidyl-prolyl isomerase
MKLFEPLKYVGNNSYIKFGGDIYYCTSFARTLDDKHMYVMNLPLHFEGEEIGYDSLNTLVITEQELIDNFKIVNEDNSLSDIEFDYEKRAKDKKEIEEFFDNMSDKEFENLLKENGIKYNKEERK